MLDTVHNQGLRFALGSFRTSPVSTLNVEADEPSLWLHRGKLSLQYAIRLAANPSNPAFEKKGKRKVQGVPQSQTAAWRKRKPTYPNKHKSNERTKSTKISSLFPKRGNRNTKRTEKHKNKMTHGKT